MGKLLYALWLIRPQIGKLQIVHNMNHRCKICSLPIWGRALSLLWRQKKPHGWNLRLKRLKCGWKYFNRYFNRISTASTVILCYMPAGKQDHHVMWHIIRTFTHLHIMEVAAFSKSTIYFCPLLCIITMIWNHSCQTGQFSSLELYSLMIMTHSSRTTGPT